MKSVTPPVPLLSKPLRAPQPDFLSRHRDDDPFGWICKMPERDTTAAKPVKRGTTPE